jgi:hypothetical protein
MKRVCPEHGPLNDGVDFCRWAGCSHNYGEPEPVGFDDPEIVGTEPARPGWFRRALHWWFG